MLHMHSSSRLLLAAMLFAVLETSTGSAQNENVLFLYDGSTEFTNRGTSSAGRMIQRFPSYLLDGAQTLKGVRAVLQDQNGSTPEIFHLELYLVPAGTLPNFNGPNPSPAPVHVESNLNFLYPGPISNQAVEGLQNIPFSTAVQLACGQDLIVALRFEAAPLWTADGLSVHYSSQTFNSSIRREVPRGSSGGTPVAMPFCYTEQNGVVLARTDRLMSVRLVIDGPVLQPYAIVPAVGGPVPIQARAKDFGLAGLFPDCFDSESLGRLDGIGWEVRSAAHAGTGSVGALWISTAPAGPGGTCIPLTPYAASLALNLAGLLPLTLTTGESQGIFDFAIPASFDLAFAAFGMNAVGIDFYCQCFILNPSGPNGPDLHATNTCRTDF